VEAHTNPPYVVVGHITRPHGTKGEFFVWSLTDRPESTFLPGARLFVGGADGKSPDPIFPPLEIAEVREYRRGFLVRFEGLQDRTRAELLRERDLLRPFEETDPLEDGEIFYHQLLGLRVYTRSGVEVGVVREVYALRPVDLLEVDRGEGESLLVPFTKDIVVAWDLASHRVVIDPPEGLLEL
jgi:16S rRNA processing protein RimM